MSFQNPVRVLGPEAPPYTSSYDCGVVSKDSCNMACLNCVSRTMTKINCYRMFDFIVEFTQLSHSSVTVISMWLNYLNYLIGHYDCYYVYNSNWIVPVLSNWQQASPIESILNFLLRDHEFNSLPIFSWFPSTLSSEVSYRWLMEDGRQLRELFCALIHV